MLKPVEWVGSTKADLKRFPAIVQDRVGFALYQAQIGLKHRDAKPLKGLGVGLELSDSRGLVKSQDTFDVGRCQTVRRREVGMPRIGV